MCNTISVYLDTVNQVKKPHGRSGGVISDRITDHLLEGTAKYLAKKLVAPYSRTWMPGILDGNRITGKWKRQRVFIVEIMGKLPFAKAIERLEEFELNCSFAYSHFNNGKVGDKYILVFILKEEIQNHLLFDATVKAFNKLFPEMVRQSCCPGKIIHGGKALIYENYDYQIPLPDLFIASSIYYIGATPSLRVQQDRSKKTSFNGISIINTVKIPRNEDIQPIKSFDWEKAFLKITILRKFKDGNTLGHHHLMGIASNLVHVNGGKKWMKGIMDQNKAYSKHNFMLINYIEKLKREPMRLEEFSPHQEDHKYPTILDAGFLKKGQVIRLHNSDKQSVEKIREMLDKVFNSVLAENDTNIHVIKAPTGVGKTEKLLDLNDAVIACPTHAVKDEIHGRFKHDRRISTPELLSFSSIELNQRLEYLYRCGSAKYANILLQKISNGETIPIKYTEEDIEPAREYHNKLNQAYQSDQVIITTHHRGLGDFKQSTLIFDEDPFRTILLPIEEIHMDDLKFLKGCLTRKNDVEILLKIISAVKAAQPNVPTSLPNISFSDDQLIEYIVTTNHYFTRPILNFLKSKYFVKGKRNQDKLLFGNIKKLPASKKIIILSATANEWMYRQAYGDRVKFYDLGASHLKGKLSQNTRYTFSKSNLKNKEVLNYAFSKVNDLPVITFKSIKDAFPNAIPDMHYGKCQGINEYRGKSLAVVGTYHFPKQFYLLVASLLGVAIPPNADRMSYQRLEHNGFDCKFQTFGNPDLQTIQFYYIESEIRQATGRARLEGFPDARVLLLSDYPLPESTFE